MRTHSQLSVELRYQAHKLHDRFWHKLPKFLGKKVRYWVLIYEGARHIQGNEIVPEVPFIEVLERSGKGVE